MARCGAAEAAGCAALATPAPPVAPAAPVVPAAVAAPAVAIDDVPTRLDTIAGDLADLTSRLAQQRSATDAAVAAARGAKSDGAWSRAQLELSRYQRAGGAIGDARGRLEAVAGTLAAAAAGGADVTALLKATGRLIARTVALGADFDQAYAAASSAVSRKSPEKQQ